MKKVILLITIIWSSITVSSLQSCNKLTDTLQVDVPYQLSDSFIIPQLPVAGDTTFTLPTVHINIDSLIKTVNSSLGASNIKSVKIDSCIMTMVNNNTETDHFGSFSALSVGLITSGSSTTIASVSNNPDVAVYTLNLSVTGVDLKNNFSSNDFIYQISVTTRRATSTALNLTVRFKFDITVGL